MIIRTKEDWKEVLDDITRYYFVVVGRDGRREEIYNAAITRAGAPPDNAAKAALWVQNINVWGTWVPGCGKDYAAFTLCFDRHTVECFAEKNLPQGNGLFLVIDRAFSKARNCEK